MQPSEYRIDALSEADAIELIGWEYQAPYDIYNMDGEGPDETADFFLDPANGYFAVRNPDGDLLGFCCFGKDGQVPGGDYSAPALDVGVGMRPDLTGHGFGTAFIDAVLRFSVKHYGRQPLRATVATFNLRSRRVCEKHGFQEAHQFTSATGAPRDFVILVRP